MTQQLDLLDLIPAEPRQPVDTAAPLHFTVAEYHPDEFDAAYSEWRQRSREDQWILFRSWHEAMCGRNAGGPNPQPSFMYDVDLRCTGHIDYNKDPDREPCQCVGDMLYRAYCVACEYWSPIVDDENTAAELLLDHCWPGWRDLPVLESKMKPSGGYSWKISDDYPEAWQVPGAPVRECRGQTRFSTRHVPGASPWEGYKMAVVRDCEVHRGR